MPKMAIKCGGKARNRDAKGSKKNFEFLAFVGTYSALGLLP